MNLILRFLKPHWKLCLITVVLLIVDVAGALFIPTLVAEMLNDGTSGASFDAIARTGIHMAAVSVLAGVCAILGGYASATLAAQVGKDMREAIYAKSLKLSVYDFRQFGTASITTRTISDITTIQFALTSTIQMVIPVPVICVLALALTFGLDAQMGVILLIVVAAVLLLAWRIMGSASPLFRKLQKLLDRMSTVLLENITGVRVVRAFNNEIREEGRMITAFCYAAPPSWGHPAVCQPWTASPSSCCQRTSSACGWSQQLAQRRPHHQGQPVACRSATLPPSSSSTPSAAATCRSATLPPSSSTP